MALYVTQGVIPGGSSFVSPPPAPLIQVVGPPQQEVVSVLVDPRIPMPPMQTTIQLPMHSTMVQPVQPMHATMVQAMPPNAPVVYPHVPQPPNASMQRRSADNQRDTAQEAQNPAPTPADKASKDKAKVSKDKAKAAPVSTLGLYFVLFLLCLLVIPALVLAAYAVSRICSGSNCFKYGVVALDSEVWSYTTESLSKWGGTCASGTKQSPINIGVSVPASQQPSYTSLSGGSFSFVGLGEWSKTAFVHVRNSALTMDGFNTFLRWGGLTWRLEEVTMHSPAEHNINGQGFAVEVQWKHRNTAGGILIVSLLGNVGGNVGEKSPEFITAATQIPAGIKGPLQIDFDVQLALSRLGLVSGGREGFYIYEGSITTPPCTENVQWLVVQMPFKIAQADLDQLKKIQGGDNNRPLQTINGRVVYGMDLVKS